MLLVAVDDTDTRSGMCTTWLAGRIREAFPELAPAGPARLVRLNPNVPWKTRGNAAVCVSFQGSLDLADAEARVAALVRAHARTDAEGTEPGWAVSASPLPRAVYERTVRDVVTLDAAILALEEAGARFGGLKTRRGLIGCAAALAWNPAEGDHTFELIAYRDAERWGAPREVDAASIRGMQRAFPGTFDSYDETNAEVVMIPRSPCPVLWGIRGENAADLPRAAEVVEGEAPSSFTLFETNQATDDHLQDLPCGRLRPFVSARVRVIVAGAPSARGGHVFLRVGDETGAVLLAAYAPTRQFRDVLGRLRPGDEITACGGLQTNPGGGLTLGVEKLRVHALARPRRKVANPRCPGCERTMKSAGRGAGYRCRACGTRGGEDAAAFEDEARSVGEGWHEVPSRARRHLAMPLKRMGASIPSKGCIHEERETIED